MHLGGHSVALASWALPVSFTEIRVELSRAEPKAIDVPGPKSSQCIEEAKFKGQSYKPFTWSVLGSISCLPSRVSPKSRPRNKDLRSGSLFRRCCWKHCEESEAGKGRKPKMRVLLRIQIAKANSGPVPWKCPGRQNRIWPGLFHQKSKEAHCFLQSLSTRGCRLLLRHQHSDQGRSLGCLPQNSTSGTGMVGVMGLQAQHQQCLLQRPCQDAS